jgi:lipoate-protein ligase A
MSVLRELGYSARLAGSSETVNGPECFSAPALHDVIDHRLRKLCGGAQRRTRQGILHQGSIQNVDLPPDFAVRLLGPVATVTRRFSLSEASHAAAKRLAAGKYGSKAWLERIA